MSVEKNTQKAHLVFWTLYGGLFAFLAYFAMYAFRKPFAAGLYDGVAAWDFAVDFKIAALLAQVIGYALSKFIGIKIVSEMTAERRGVAIISLIGLSWFALVGFAIAPPPYKIFAMFMNGLPLGMIWGLVFSYLEGRRTTEVLGAMLCASFILASGVVKSVGVWLMDAWAVSDFWMPAATGLLFFPLLAISVFALSRFPAPDQQDIEARTERRPMTGRDRMIFLRANGPGIAFLVLAYVLFAVIRDFRDNFAAEIWRDLGFEGVASVFALSELPVAVLTLLMLAGLVIIRSNRKALLWMHGLIILGSLLLIGSTFAFQQGLLSPVAWMITSGAGLYFAYTPFNAMLFDRLIAARHQIATAGFLIYVADAFGYVGSVSLMIYKNFSTLSLDWLTFFMGLLYIAGGASLVFMLGSALYFSATLRR